MSLRGIGNGKRPPSGCSALALQSRDRRQNISAREGFLRASNYFRTAEFFLRDHPATDPEVADPSGKSGEVFSMAAKLFDAPVEAGAHPDLTPPCRAICSSSTIRERRGQPSCYNSGFDSDIGGVLLRYRLGGAAARIQRVGLRKARPGCGTTQAGLGLSARLGSRGHPGSGLRGDPRRGRPDPHGAVGYSLGGYWVARAAAFEHRVAALVLDDGIYDFHDAFARAMPLFLMQWINDKRDDIAEPVLAVMMSASSQVRWGLQNGMWAMGADSAAEYLRMTTSYTLDGVADQITCPTLIMDADNDQFLKGQPEQVHQKLSAPTTLITLREADGAGEHCHMGAMSRLHQGPSIGSPKHCGTPEPRAGSSRPLGYELRTGSFGLLALSQECTSAGFGCFTGWMSLH